MIVCADVALAKQHGIEPAPEAMDLETFVRPSVPRYWAPCHPFILAALVVFVGIPVATLSFAAVRAWWDVLVFLSFVELPALLFGACICYGAYLDHVDRRAEVREARRVRALRAVALPEADELGTRVRGNLAR